jgi:hypothetical protein
MDVFIFQSFSHSFYGLFDQEGHNALDQTEFFEMLKLNARLVKLPYINPFKTVAIKKEFSFD